MTKDLRARLQETADMLASAFETAHLSRRLKGGRVPDDEPEAIYVRLWEDYQVVELLREALAALETVTAGERERLHKIIEAAHALIDPEQYPELNREMALVLELCFGGCVPPADPPAPHPLGACGDEGGANCPACTARLRAAPAPEGNIRIKCHGDCVIRQSSCRTDCTGVNIMALEAKAERPDDHEWALTGTTTGSKADPPAPAPEGERRPSAAVINVAVSDKDAHPWRCGGPSQGAARMAGGSSTVAGQLLCGPLTEGTEMTKDLRERLEAEAWPWEPSPLTLLLREALAAWETSAPPWQPIETAPTMRNVLVWYRNALGNGRCAMACYYTANALEMDDDYALTFNEASDTSYAPEGWYEEHDSDAPLMPLAEDPTHWMPLPAPPASPEGEQT